MEGDENVFVAFVFSKKLSKLPTRCRQQVYTLIFLWLENVNIEPFFHKFYKHFIKFWRQTERRVRLTLF